MGRFGLAFKVFFDVLFNADKAEKIRTATTSVPDSGTATPEPPKLGLDRPTPTPVKPLAQRNDALTLLETLQREARFLDFIQEDISSYDDKQVGQAVRDVHRGTRSVLDRIFKLGPATLVAEGDSFTLTGQESKAQFRLVGKVTDSRPVSGVIVHAGWKAQQCELPIWSGADNDRLILSPAEVEIH